MNPVVNYPRLVEPRLIEALADTPKRWFNAMCVI
jgi:hypothetical protein